MKELLRGGGNQASARRERRQKDRGDNDYYMNREYLITRKEEQLLDTTSKLCRQISYSLSFRKRTFKTKRCSSSVNREINCEQVRLKLEEECRNCHG